MRPNNQSVRTSSTETIANKRAGQVRLQLDSYPRMLTQTETYVSSREREKSLGARPAMDDSAYAPTITLTNSHVMLGRIKSS